MAARTFLAAFACSLALLACARHPPLTPVSAGALAARLANDRCQQVYGARPFQADDFEASQDAGRWHWGGSESGKVDGYEVDVSFDRFGGAGQVMVRIPEE